MISLKKLKDIGLIACHKSFYIFEYICFNRPKAVNPEASP